MTELGSPVRAPQTLFTLPSSPPKGAENAYAIGAGRYPMQETPRLFASLVEHFVRANALARL
jgi:hypothetical protein